MEKRLPLGRRRSIWARIQGKLTERKSVHSGGEGASAVVCLQEHDRGSLAALTMGTAG